MSDLVSRADVLALAEKGYIVSNSNYKKVCDLINELPSADRQTELLQDGTLKVHTKNGMDVKRVLVLGDDFFGGLYYADSDEEPTGEWVFEDEYGDLWVCDQCGFAGEYKSNYCPNCGAKMKGEKL